MTQEKTTEQKTTETTETRETTQSPASPPPDQQPDGGRREGPNDRDRKEPETSRA